MTTNENAPGSLVQKSNALNISHDSDESARFRAEIERAEGEARSEALLSSASLAERHQTWKAAHPSFDPLFEAIRSDKNGRTAR